MKLHRMVITACMMLLGIAAITAFATRGNMATAQGPGQGPGGPPHRHPPGPPDGGFLLRLLDLTDAQKEQIKAIEEAEDAKAEPYLKQLEDAHKALDDATARGQFNEAQVRSIAASQAQAIIELIVLKARKDAAIYQVLTPEQRARLDRLREERPRPEGGQHPPRPRP
ncbi:MAG TPA: Spy/CpxP family protein refolding chaperone [Blastocatellia bacterium]|nr:Spy/CpxP family protein refolding chaperone [Blastocatellia bacterium]